MNVAFIVRSDRALRRGGAAILAGAGDGVGAGFGLGQGGALRGAGLLGLFVFL